MVKIKTLREKCEMRFESKGKKKGVLKAEAFHTASPLERFGYLPMSATIPEGTNPP